MERIKVEGANEDNLRPEQISRMSLEAYDPKAMANLTFTEDVATTDYPDRMEVVRRLLSSMGLALVRPQVDTTSAGW